MRDYREAKVMAQTLRDALAAKNLPLSHSESLEIISRILGQPDWNTLSAKIQEERNGVAPPHKDANGLGMSADDRSRRLAEQALPRTAITITPEQFDRFVGYYQLEPGVLFKLYREGGRFFSQITGQQPVEIYPEREDKFFATVVAAQLSFVTNSQDRVTDLILHQNGYERPWKRLETKAAERQLMTLETRIRDNLADSRTEKALRRLIDGIISGHPHYDEIGSEQAEAVREQLDELRPLIGDKGKITAMKFIGVQDNGDDTYHVEHERRLFRWTIGLNSAGKTIRSWVTSGG